MVTIPHTLVGQPDVGNGIPVFGVLPDDAALRAAAMALLDKNRQERGQATMPVAGLSGDEIMRRMREGN
jgi:hypothetical protein